MVASWGMQMCNWKIIHYNVQVSLLSLTDRLINFKRMGTYCEISWNCPQKCSWSASLKKPHTGRSTGFQNLVIKHTECLVSQSTNALRYLKPYSTRYIFYNKSTFKCFRGCYRDTYLWQLWCSSSP